MMRVGEKLRLWLGLAEDWDSGKESAEENLPPGEGDQSYLIARAAAGTLAMACSDPLVVSAMCKQDCARTIVSLLESQQPELVHRALFILIEMMTAAAETEGTVEATPSEEKDEEIISKHAVAMHLMQGGVIPAIGVVVGLGLPELAELAKQAAQLLSDHVKQ